MRNHVAINVPSSRNSCEYIVKHCDDVHWNVDEYIVIEEIVCHLSRFLKND